MTAAANDPKSEINSLTGIRGVAAFLVMLYHIPGNPHFARDGWNGFSHNYLCVDLFFVLSGFVLAMRYRDWFIDGLKPAKISSFLLLRLGLIYPGYIVASLIYYARWLLNLNGQRTIFLGPFDLAANALLIHGWGVGAFAVCDPSWSVSVELFAYLLFPFLIFALAAPDFRRAALLLLVSCAGLTLVAQSHLGVQGALDVIDEHSLLPLLRGLCEFSLGLIGYELARRDTAKSWLGSGWMTIGLLAAIPGLIGYKIDDELVVLLFPLLILNLYYAPDAANLLFGNRIVYRLGVLSYSFYLLHSLMRDIVGHVMEITARLFPIKADWLFIAASVAASLLAAELLQRWVEIPGRKLARKTAQRLNKTEAV